MRHDGGIPAMAAEPVRRASRRALASWVLFDWAAQPYYTLILTFLFAPYFASAVIGDPAQGQAIWGYAASLAGILVGLGSPLLGALADGRGRRKPWIALFSVLLAAGMAVLWWAVPAATGAQLLVVLAGFVLATVAAEFATVFTNAMMPALVPASQLGRLSGAGWAMGYVGGLISLAVMAGLVVANPATGKTLLGLDPLLRLDLAAREGDRLVGPFCAVWYIAFMVPFFLFVPDAKGPARPPSDKTAFAELMQTIRELPGHRDMMLFLLARMIYADGLSAIFAFGGIYGASVFGWQALELGIFGIILTLTGAIGGWLGGVLDDRIGAKPIILASLVLLLLGLLGILSIDKSHMLYGIDIVPKAVGSKPFSSAGEQAFLAFAILVGVVAAPVQASSRSLLARLAPPEKLTQYFGLFAFSGKVTSFLAPFMIATVTWATGSQRGGIAVIVLFLLAGMILLLPVKAPAPDA